MPRKVLLIPILLLFLFTSTACGLTSLVGNEPEVAPVSAPVLEEPTAIPVIPTDPPTEVPPTAIPPTAMPEVAAPPLVDNGLGAVAALQGTLEDIYADVNPSVVHIQHSGGEGSGFVWNDQGYIVSNDHVVAGASQLAVTFADGTVATATIVGTDPESDLAVIRVNLPADQLRPVAVADSTQLRVGQLSIAIGNPFGQEGTMTVGFISALGRRLSVENSPYNIPDVIQTDAAINPGNSGGVLLNENGELVGVTSAIISPVRASSGIGFAIPSVIVQRVVPALIADGDYQHPFLGITGTDLTPDLAQALGLPATQRGAVLISTTPGGPADQAGLDGNQNGGDVVIAVNGQPINNMDDLIVYLARYGEVGESVTFTVIRGGQQANAEVVLGARPG